MILITKSSLLKCNYHQINDKSCRKWDGTEKKGRLTGTPYESTDPATVKSRIEADAKGAGGIVYAKLGVRRSESGAEVCDCGCLLKDAIWGLYLWKTGEIEYEGRSETYDSPLTPRNCGFEITRLKRWGMKLDDIWTHELKDGHYVERSIQKRLQGPVRTSLQKLRNHGGLSSLVGLEDLLTFEDVPKVEN
ncbi:hypothetical protein PM082_015504 [Marasmius tenuissimus]|nr:hypothetical protein PM082_015504 [Marasmius tenuissimus]